MVSDDVLAAAISESIITDAQAAALQDLASRRERERIAEMGTEEHFRFMRGFNDFFLALGVAFLCSSMLYFSTTPLMLLLSAILVWALAELLVGRMRLVLPGILLACFFMILVFGAFPVDEWLTTSTGGAPRIPRNQVVGLFGAFNAGRLAPLAVAAKALIAGIAALLFYARFRLPFVLLPAAASGVFTIVALTTQLSSATLAYSYVLLACGLAVFAIAMLYDVSDRERTTRRSDCAFWLHLLAAPLVVHSFISIVAPNSLTATNMTNSLAATILLIVMALALTAITIDRRALLVSTLVYLGAVIAYAVNSAAIQRADALFSTLAVLGVVVVTLGVGWQPLRRRLLSLLPASLVHRLPPVPAKL